MNILIDLEQSKSFSDSEVIEGVCNLDIQFDKQVINNKVSNIEFSNQQKFEQIPEIRDSVTEVDHLKGNFCSKSVFHVSKKVLTETEISVLEKGLDFRCMKSVLIRSFSSPYFPHSD